MIEYTNDEIKKGKLISMISYIWLISLVVFLTTNNNYAKFHSKQSVRLSIIFTLPIVILYIINKFIDSLWLITDILLTLFIGLYIIYILMGIYDIIRSRGNEFKIIKKIFKGSKK